MNSVILLSIMLFLACILCMYLAIQLSRSNADLLKYLDISSKVSTEMFKYESNVIRSCTELTQINKNIQEDLEELISRNITLEVFNDRYFSNAYRSYSAIQKLIESKE